MTCKKNYFNLNIMSIMVYLCVFFITFQSFAVVNIGKFGIQISLLISLFGIILLYLKFCCKKNFSFKITSADKWLIFMYIVELISTIINVLRGIDITQDLHVYITELLGGCVFYFFRISVFNKNLLKNVLKVYMVSSVLSALYGIYQVIAFKLSLPGGLLFRNNASFNMVNTTNIHRAFAFTAEPSFFVNILLSSYVIALFMYISTKDKFYKMSLYILLIASLFTASQVIVILPIIYLLVIKGVDFKKYVKLFKHIILITVLILIFIMLMPNILDQFQERIINFSTFFLTNPSNHIRLGTIVGGLRLFEKYPIFGAGLGNANLEVVHYYPWPIYQINKSGIDSFIVSKLAQNGILGLISLIGFYMSCFFNKRLLHMPYDAKAVKYSFLVLIMILSITTYNNQFYNYWMIAALSINVNIIYSDEVLVKRRKEKLYNEYSFSNTDTTISI